MYLRRLGIDSAAAALIVTRCEVVKAGDGRTAWNSLKRYQNVGHVEGLLAEHHSVPRAQRRNLRKQAEQLRYCLIQAAEYFGAADGVSLATKPVLLYYGLMSLALAEVLFKQGGDSSLDRARDENAQHGLTLKVQGKPSLMKQIADSATALQARPQIKQDGTRGGTFDLWHRSARESPVCGKFERVHQNGGRTEGISVLAICGDVRMTPVPDNGLSLLDCFRALPPMSNILASCGVKSELVRARMYVRDFADDTRESVFAVQNAPSDVLDRFYPRLRFKDVPVDHIRVLEIPGGQYILSWRQGPDYPAPKFNMPNSVQVRPEETHFCSRNECLNEFGLYYLGMYILGNYARYYPEQWMRDVETASDLATVAERFTDNAIVRGPWLALSELTLCHHLFE